jgi:hypothetical protein
VEDPFVKKALLTLIAASIAMLFSTIAFGDSTAKPMLTVKPPVAKAKTLKPPANAKKGTMVGKKGKVSASTSNAPGDTDSVWVQQIDIDGDGDMDTVDALWDDEDKVLYLYDELDVDCAMTDGMASTSLLVAVYGDGNTAKQKSGSGFWVASLDEGECLAEETDVYGCTFDAMGNATMCDEVDTWVDDVLVFE